MQPHVTVIGASVVDAFFELPDSVLSGKKVNRVINLRFGEKIASKSEFVCVGGAGANVSVGLARCGFEADLHSSVGKDVFGQFVRDQLRDGIRFHNVGDCATTSMSAVMLVGTERTILTTGNTLFANTKRLSRKSSIHVGPIHGNADDFLEALTKHVDGSGQRLSLNPSMDTIKGRGPGLAKLLTRTEILFVNQSEAVALSRCANGDDVNRLFKRILKMGPSVVCITQGKRGAFMRTTSGVSLFAKPLTDVFSNIDSTGAGDAFAAGFLSVAFGEACLNEGTLRRALAAASVNAASVVGHIGAQAGLLSRRQIQRHVGSVGIELVG